MDIYQSIIFRGFHPDDSEKETIEIDGKKIKGKYIYWDIFGHCVGGFTDEKRRFRRYTGKGDFYYAQFVIPEDVIFSTIEIIKKDISEREEAEYD